MKKIFISLGIILVIAGIVIVGIYGGAKGFTDWDEFRFHDLAKADKAIEFAADELKDVRKIEIEAEQFCVYVVESEDADKVSVKYVSDLPKGVNITATQEGDTLKVTQKMEKSVNLAQKLWNGEYFKYFVVIELPKNETFSKVKIHSKIKQGALLMDDGIFD